MPTSGPLKHAQASDPIWGNAARSPRMKTMKHLTCYSENHTLRRFLTCAFTATSWQSERHVCCVSDYSWAAVGNCRNRDSCYFFAFGIPAHGIPKIRLASQSVKDPAVGQPSPRHLIVKFSDFYDLRARSSRQERSEGQCFLHCFKPGPRSLQFPPGQNGLSPRSCQRACLKAEAHAKGSLPLPRIPRTIIMGIQQANAAQRSG